MNARLCLQFLLPGRPWRNRSARQRLECAQLAAAFLIVLALCNSGALAAAEPETGTNAAVQPSASAPAATNSPSRLKFKFALNAATNEEAAFETTGLAPTNDVVLPVELLPADTCTNPMPKAAAGAPAQDRLQMYQSKLELARQQRLMKDFSAAELILVRLLESTAPMEIKRSAMLEIGLLAQDAKQYVRAQQIFTQFVHTFREDPEVPGLLLRQGALYREMGAPTLALSKFYAVMSSALSLKLERLEYYQRLVLQAQTEVAETYYLQGQFAEAADFFTRLLKLDNPQLNQGQIHYKLVRSYSSAGAYTETVGQAELFLAHYPKADQVPEIRFLLADALKRLGRKSESTQQVLSLLQELPPEGPGKNTWLYWQQRAGNEIANQLYQEGDCLGALQIYLRLAELNPAPSWRLSAWYQAALIYERLKQPQKATEFYARIIDAEKGREPTAASPSLATVVEMARWRQQRLAWQVQADGANQQLGPPVQPAASKPRL